MFLYFLILEKRLTLFRIPRPPPPPQFDLGPIRFNRTDRLETDSRRVFRHGTQRKGKFWVHDRRRAGYTGKHGSNVERITGNTLSGRRLTAMRIHVRYSLWIYIYMVAEAYGVRSFQRRTFLVRKQTFNSPCKYYVCGSRRFGTLFVTLSTGQRINVSLPPVNIISSVPISRD